MQDLALVDLIGTLLQGWKKHRSPPYTQRPWHQGLVAGHLASFVSFWQAVPGSTGREPWEGGNIGFLTSWHQGTSEFFTVQVFLERPIGTKIITIALT